MEKRTIFYAAMALGTAAVTISVAYAVDNKAMVPGFCKVDSGSVVVIAGAVSNTSASAATIHCPIVRDQIDNVVNQVDLTVADRHPTQNICCHLMSRSDTNVTETTQSSCETDTGVSTLTLLSGSASFDPPDRASLMLICTIPPASGGQASEIFRYYVTENS